MSSRRVVWLIGSFNLHSLNRSLLCMPWPDDDECDDGDDDEDEDDVDVDDIDIHNFYYI